jgi:hypothetical protein
VLTEEGTRQSVESDDDSRTSPETCGGGTDTRLGLHRSSRERSRGRVSVEERADGICISRGLAWRLAIKNRRSTLTGDTDSDKFLIGVDLVAVHSPES